MQPHSKDPSLIQAIINCDLSVVRRLITEGADVHELNEFDEMPIHKAVGNRLIGAPAIKLLIANGADVNVVNNYKNTPLHIAATFRHFTAVELLVAEGANVRAVNINGNTPLKVLSGNEDRIRALLAPK